ncbi:MAG: hypothetical protein KAU28_02705 [Phycisphaerae bacterium]|nr:hypothetical protein [Phycisphaerae bacterium]
MDGARKIWVLKSDGDTEVFDALKLAATMWRAIRDTGGSFNDARDLAETIEIYLSRKGQTCIASTAIFEMCVKVLRRVRLRRAACRLETHHAWRNARRLQIQLDHYGGKTTFWDKGWLCKFACRSWHLSPATGRIIAGIVEQELLAGQDNCVSRQSVIEMLNARVVEFGLADAVPVRP